MDSAEEVSAPPRGMHQGARCGEDVAKTDVDVKAKTAMCSNRVIM
jgi:hypothetical protein